MCFSNWRTDDHSPERPADERAAPVRVVSQARRPRLRRARGLRRILELPVVEGQHLIQIHRAVQLPTSSDFAQENQKMRLKKIQLTNFRTFPAAEWDVPEGVSLITGPNGSGKSTLMGVAAAWGIWGQVPGRSQDHLVRHGESEMIVKIMFSTGDGESTHMYSISRRFRLNKSGKGGVTQLTFGSDGVDLTGAVNKETQAKINEVCGIFEVWSATAYVGQREGAGQFLEANAYERKQILRDLISAGGNWEAWEQQAKAENTKVALDLNRSEGSIEDLEQIANELPDRMQHSDAMKVQVGSTAGQVMKAEEELRKSEKTVADYLANIEAWSKLEAERVTDRDGHEKAVQAETVYADQIRVQGDLAEKLPEYEASLTKQNEAISARRDEITDVETANAQIMSENAKLTGKFDALNAHFQTDFAAWDTTKVNKDAEIANDLKHADRLMKRTEHGERLALSLAENRCPECKQLLNDEHAEATRLELESLTDWRKSSSEGEAIIEKWATFTHPDPPVAPVRGINAEYLPLPTTLVANEGLQNSLVAARSAAAEIERLTPLHAASVEKVDRVKDKAEKSRTAVEEAGDPTDQRTMLHEQQTDVGRFKRTLENYKTIHEEALATLAKAETLVEVAEQQKTELKTRREKIGDLKVELADWEHVVAATGTNGIRQLIIDQSVGTLESASNRWLQIIAPGFEIAFTTQSDTDRETFEEGVIMPSGAIQPWSELSGAQSVAVAFAVRMGMSEVGGAAYGVRYETIYLDEADSWLTGDYQLQFMQMLSRIAETGVDVVAITHIDAVIDSVDQITRIVPIDSETSEVVS